MGTLHMCLANNVFTNVLQISTTNNLWRKLEELYKSKGASNLYLNKKFHTLHMNEDIKIYDHLSLLNNIVFELEVIGV